MSQAANKTKHGLVKAVNFTIDQWNHDINDDIKMNSTQNKGKSVFAQGFIRTWKEKNYKHMTLVSKNVYIDKLDNIVKQNNTYNMEHSKWNLLV